MSPIFLSDSAYLRFGTASSTTGAATNADATPSVVIAEDGVDLGYAPTVTNIATGLYQVQIDATAANGFEAGRRYVVHAVATVGGVTGRDGIGEFEVLAVDLNTSLDVAVSSRMATYAQPTGFLAATFPGGTVANTTNITAGTVTTTTNLTNLPAIPADWITAAGIAAGAITSSEAPALANLDVAVSTRLASAGYTAPDNATIVSIQGDTNDIQTRLPAALVGGRMASNAEVVGDKSGYSLSVAAVDAIWDEVVDAGFTGRELLRGFASALLAKLSGADAMAPVFRDLADTKSRITATTDISGNRTSVTLDLT
jgi:hypothetical protein